MGSDAAAGPGSSPGGDIRSFLAPAASGGARGGGAHDGDAVAASVGGGPIGVGSDGAGGGGGGAGSGGIGFGVGHGVEETLERGSGSV